MELGLKTPERLRNLGIIWICFAPIVLAMAMISKVRSPTTYYVQLASFSLVALAGLVCGFGALSGRPWAARGLLVLNWLAGVYFLGAPLILAIWLLFLAL
jgi:hypothetical protein